MISVLLALFIRKANVQCGDELSLKVVSEVNREYGIKYSKIVCLNKGIFEYILQLVLDVHLSNNGNLCGS